MKSLTAFSHRVLHDMGDWCRISTDRDCETVTLRVEHEGLSFLTITLPAFSKDFLKSLEDGSVAPTAFPGFSRRGGLPRFLGGFLELVFDRTTGVLLDSPSIEAIRSVYGFTAMFGKMQLPCAPHRVAAAMDDYVECDKEVRQAQDALSPLDLDELSSAALVLFGDLFTRVDKQVYDGELIPKHGPGATADRCSANAKYRSNKWTYRLEEYFPAGEFLFPNWSWYDQLQSVDFLEPEEEMPVRVISVPKTLKTPRIIAIEPVWQQYCQQALLEALTDGIQENDNLRSLLGYLDQMPNQELARKGSLDGTLATLDLSEASDRVSMRVVATLFHHHPYLLGALEASRSTTARVPGHGVIPLAKFASMGSAVCFPVEAIVFTTMVFVGIARQLNTRVTPSLVREFRGRVRVYGDDIIVPVDMMRSVICTLEAFGLKVNARKSFGAGRFRESCGGDFYAGHRITPVRVRRMFPTSRKHVEEIVSLVSLRNHLYEVGFERAVNYLDEIAWRYLRFYPEVPVGSDILGRWTFGTVTAERSHPYLHKPLVRAHVLVHELPTDTLSGKGALMKYFLKRGDLPITDRKHLQRAGRPVSVDIKTRWVSLDER